LTVPSISGRKLVDIVRKVSLKAVLLLDDKRICIDTQLPRIKHPWASCHETGHRILYLHKPFFFGDTAEITLDHQANVMLLDDHAFSAYRSGGTFEYTGGWATRSPVQLRPPSAGHWHVVVDLGGGAGRVRAGVRSVRRPREVGF